VPSLVSPSVVVKSVAVSVPLPPLKRSAPDPPVSRSVPLPPPRLSSPVPPDRLSLPLSPPDAPALRALTAWERLLADYGSFKISIAEHPLELLRPDLPQAVKASRELERTPDRSRVSVAGLVVARQRPATAKGVTFMLLEDEWGTINLIVPPPVYRRHRLAVRAEAFVLARGRLERRLGTTNVVVDEIRGLERPDLPLADVKHIEPPADRETGREREELAAAAGDLRAVLPAPHSFGARGR